MTSLKMDQMARTTIWMRRSGAVSLQTVARPKWSMFRVLTRTKEGKKTKEKKVKLAPEEAKRIKEENSKLVKTVKKVMSLLDSSMKDANKATKSSNADQQFKNEVWAAKEILKNAKKVGKKYKERTLEELSFEHTEETAKALKAQLDKKATAILQIDSMLSGGFDPSQLEQFAEAAKKRKMDKENAQDVS